MEREDIAELREALRGLVAEDDSMALRHDTADALKAVVNIARNLANEVFELQQRVRKLEQS